MIANSLYKRHRSNVLKGITLGLLALGLVSGCASTGENSSCAENTLPEWWSNYRVDGLHRGKFTGAGTEQRSNQREAERAALASARRELSGWLDRQIFSATTWYASEHERSNETVTPQRVSGLVESVVAELVAKSKKSLVDSYAGCEGQFKSYVLAELDSKAVSTDVANRIIDALSGAQALQSLDVVAALDKKLNNELMKLVGEANSKYEELDVMIVYVDDREREAKRMRRLLRRAGFDSRLNRSTSSANRQRYRGKVFGHVATKATVERIIRAASSIETMAFEDGNSVPTWTFDTSKIRIWLVR